MMLHFSFILHVYQLSPAIAHLRYSLRSGLLSMGPSLQHAPQFLTQALEKVDHITWNISVNPRKISKLRGICRSINSS
jgi:hypothetical protein